MTDKQTPAEDKGAAKLAELEKQVAQRQQAEKTKNVQQSAHIKPASKPQQTKTLGLWLFTFFNFLLISALAAGAYWGWMQWQQLQQTQTASIDAQDKYIQTALSSQGDAEAELLSRQAALEQQVSELQQQLAVANQVVQSNSNKLGEISGRRPSDWLLAEADYLVRMAGRKMWLEQDVRTAVLMLQSADSRLQDLEDPSLLPIRELIANDIQALQQVNPVNTTSLALSLSAMANQSSSLVLAMPVLPELPQQTDKVELSDSVWDAGANLRKIWHWFSRDFADIRRRDVPIKPLLSEQQQWLVREKLRFALMQAQSAVLQEKQALFGENVQLAMATLIEHFDLEQAEAGQFIQSLQALQQMDIERIYPAQLSAMQPLKDLLDSRLQNIYGDGTLQP